MGLAYLALAWAIGLFAAERLTTITTTTWLLLGLGGAGAWFFTREVPRWRLAAALLAMFGLAASRMASQPRTSDLATYNGRGGVTVEGVIIDPPDARDLYTQVRIQTDAIATVGGDVPTDGLLLARLPPTSGATYGDRVRVTGRLRTPEEGDAFDYATYLARRGVFSLLDRVSSVDIVSSGHGNGAVYVALAARDWARGTLSALLPEPHAGILTAILTGDERGISPSVADAYAQSGIAHLLAVSGFNMAIVGGFALRGLERAERRRWLWLALGLMLLFAYTMLVGFSPSASRAAVMAGVVLVGAALNRRSNPLVSLGFALIVLTAIDPGALFDLGFQLSFGAVLGIAVIGRPLTRMMSGLLRPEMPQPLPRMAVALLAEAAVVTVAASALTMPLAGLAFGRLPLMSFVTNILVVPVQPLVMLLGGAVLLLSPVTVLAQAVAYLCLVPLSWTTTAARTMAHMPLEIAFNLHQSIVGAGFGAAIFASVMTATRPPWLEWFASRKVRLASVLVVLAIWIIAIGAVTSQPDGQLHVWILDVGHSHAVLVQTPGGAHILIDGGRYPSRLATAIGDRLPFNDADLDAVILTQPDPFEISAVASILARYPVGAVYSSGQPNRSDEYAAITARAAVLPMLAGQSLDMGDGASIEVLHPAETPGLDDALDDVALVLRIRYGGISFLLGGEASREAQSALLELGEELQSTVFMLPKHGGVRSLDGDLLDVVQPSLIVIQTDRANVLGDPDPDVLAALPDVPLYRTDLHGALHFFTDGTDLYLETERSP